MSLRVPGFVLCLALLLGHAAEAQYQQPPAPPPPPQQQPRPPAQAQPKPPPAPPQAKPAAAGALPRIDAARKLYQSGKLLQSAEELSAAIDSIYGQLSRRYAATLPAAPQGWTAEAPDPQRLALMGGAAPAARDYRQAGGQPGAPAQGQPRMNARIVLDSDAVKSMAPLFGPQLPQGVPQTVKRVRIGDQDAVVAYDPQQRGGEVSVLVGNRILLQVEGMGVAGAEPMIATMRNWNIGELKRLAGL